jgi:ABC-type transport system involved in multi-copper enzyme maturation permease subunit
MSPIHDQSYRRYQGTRLPLGRSWAIIAGAGIRGMLGRKLFLLLMVLSWIPFVVRAVQIYAVTMYPQAGQILPLDASLFRDFLEQQGPFVFFVSVYVGSGLIANDRRANALQIYLSKPLLRVEYIAGKLAVLLFFLASITLLPALLLVIVQMALAGGLGLVRTSPQIVPAVVLASIVRVGVASFTMLALSSLSKSTRYVAVLYTGVIFFTEAMYGVLTLITGSTAVAWVSIPANLEQVADVMFRLEPSYDTPLVVSAFVLVGVVVLSVSVLERRVRGVEIVS